MKIKRFLAFWLSVSMLVMGCPMAALAEEDGIPTYELVRFSNFERVYNEETGDLLYGDTLYANWTRADGVDGGSGYDLETDYPGREYLHLKVTMQLSSTDPSLDPDEIWDNFTLKLRSPDVENKEGDPNLKENGGNDDTNKEHNYGWWFEPEDVEMKDGYLELSVPLNTPCDNSRGLMDWTQVQRIILTMGLTREVEEAGLANTCSMTLSDVKIVNDVMRITRAEVLTAADDRLPEGIVYRQDSMDLFASTREQALALVADETTTLQQLRDVRDIMQTVRDNMVEVTYSLLDFSRLKGTYPGEDMNTLFADWVYAYEAGDGVGVDISRHDRSHLYLQVEFTLEGPEGYDGVWNTDGWVLLRSVDTEKAATYGVSLASENEGIGQLKTGVNRLSIPLDADEEEGLTILANGDFDWTAINRMQLYIAPENYQKGDFTLTVTMARVIDVTLTEYALPTLQTAIDRPVKEERAYTPETWQVYAAARDAALAAKADYVYLTADDLTVIAAALDEAVSGLVERPLYTTGDVDGDGDVTANDALLALQAATGKVTLSESALLAAEADGEGAVTANDALMILQYATKKIQSFPVEG